jgi:hypothetical protein
MRFQITLNMPSRSGNSGVHQVIGDHPSATLQEFVDALAEQQIIVVDEIYKDNDAPKGIGDYYKVGQIAINSAVVGKIKILTT